MRDEKQQASGMREVSLPSQKRGPRPVVIVLILLLVACVAAGVAGGIYLMRTFTQIQDVENAQNIVPEIPSASNGSQAAPSSDKQTGTIDFEALQKKNADVYAWIYIPDTNVNYPVCQNAQDNAYYLTHGASGEASDVGAIFSEAQFNHKDFQDPVTVLYGHNGYGSTMFSDLHEYARSEFLDAHDKVYVYVPGRVYTYQVFSTFMAGDRHIMDVFNFQSSEGVAAFVDYLKEPGAIDAQVKDVDVKSDDKILVLQTCNTGAIESAGRYLVCGGLVDEQPTSK